MMVNDDKEKNEGKVVTFPKDSVWSLCGIVNYGDNGLQEYFERNGIPYVDNRIVATKAQLEEISSEIRTELRRAKVKEFYRNKGLRLVD